jgi:hypothetical protein
MLSFLDIINESNELIHENITWVKIKSIKDSKNHTYDFSLPNDDNDFWCHSVIYNGILGHQTPNGYDPLYHKAYVTAQAGDNNFNIVEMKWYQDPRYNGRNKSMVFPHGMSWELRDDKTGEVVESIFDPCSGDINHYTIEKNGKECTVPESTWVDMIGKGYTPTSPWFEDMCAQLNHNPRSIAQELLCVEKTTMLDVMDNEPGEIKRISIENLYNEL